jgi:hypothetical protein
MEQDGAIINHMKHMKKRVKKIYFILEIYRVEQDVLGVEAPENIFSGTNMKKITRTDLLKTVKVAFVKQQVKTMSVKHLPTKIIIGSRKIDQAYEDWMLHDD